MSGAIAQLSAEGRSAEATEETAVAAGRLLGAQWVISGGYQRLGDRLRITARVVEVATATVVHTAIVDGTVTDLFALQDRLATNLRQRLTREGRTATPAVTARASEPAPVDAAPRATPEDAEPAVERPPAAAATPVFAAGTADPTRIINSPAPPLAPATIARDALRRATLRAVPLTDSLEMDGVLDEDVYETVPSFGDFIQQIPLAGEPSTERTEAWVFMIPNTSTWRGACGTQPPKRDGSSTRCAGIRLIFSRTNTSARFLTRSTIGETPWVLWSFGLGRQRALDGVRRCLREGDWSRRPARCGGLKRWSPGVTLWSVSGDDPRTCGAAEGSAFCICQWRAGNSGAGVAIGSRMRASARTPRHGSGSPGCCTRPSTDPLRKCRTRPCPDKGRVSLGPSGAQSAVNVIPVRSAFMGFRPCDMYESCTLLS